MSIEGWKKVFLSGAIFNWSVAALFTAAPGFAFDILQLGEPPANPIWLALFVWLVAVFGYGYFLISKDPQQHRDIVTLGILGKMGVVVIVGGYWFADFTSTIFMVVVGGDLVYSLLFFRFLKSVPGGEAGAK
jgi:hypothetical protein